MNVSINQAAVAESDLVATMVQELLGEIKEATGEPYFNVDTSRLHTQAQALLLSGSYVVFLARNEAKLTPCGFIAMFEGYALYTEGVFGVFPELYVRPSFRSEGIGAKLLQHAVEYGLSQGWNRLEVTTPPVRVFSRTLEFYERYGFAISGGTKLNRVLHS